MAAQFTATKGFLVRDAVLQVPGVRGCDVNMVFDPPWDKSRMSDEAQVALDMF